ncbi:transmembrane emp24 domain-containing protein 4 isoform 1-T1 [Liasis olivaceus]
MRGGGHGGRAARGAAGRAALGGPRGAGALLPHRGDGEALLHRGDPGRDHGHRQLPDAALGQAGRGLPALHAGAGHVRGGPGPGRQGEAAPCPGGRGAGGGRRRRADPAAPQVVLSRQYGSAGRFTFTSHTPGEHQICLHSNSTRLALFAGGKLRVHLDIQVGEHTNNYPEIAAKDKLTELQLRARQLLDQVEQIQKEQNYQRFREERFRMTSESTNQRVLWWSIAQTVILILTGIWQMRHLKSFFEAKKLV